MSRSVSAPSSVTKTSPCWNGFIVPGSTFRYGSSFCIVTRRPRAFRRLPRLEAVRPLPREEATPPVTNRCLGVCVAAKRGSRGLAASEGRDPSGPRETRLTAGPDGPCDDVPVSAPEVAQRVDCADLADRGGAVVDGRDGLGAGRRAERPDQPGRLGAARRAGRDDD